MNGEKNIQTVKSSDDINEDDRNYSYQKNLTEYLDQFDEAFDQDLINIVVLWKVNRYVEIDGSILSDVNELQNKGDCASLEIIENAAREVLENLLKIKGIKLPMASTILRFRNPKVFQIIDQRVYRSLSGIEMGDAIKKVKKAERIKHKEEKKAEKSKPKQERKKINKLSKEKIEVEFYFNYLKEIRELSKKLNIDFEDMDRIIYKWDKRVNNDIPLKNYQSLSD